MSQDQANLEKDRRILETLRKTLAQVIKEITPANTTVGIPLEPSTLDDVHMCFDLISTREREITLAIKQRDKEAKQQGE
ncbi:segregation and condensation protein A [Leucothrix arctica]|uniref:Segregation and condensation protein A n=1 Tax=Leucothrix arctica TaxID=1481894 RepID=A0A317CBN5_9GAMM|nr:segregation and condensation protein A [Leucothrix arctica]PWQ95968.1 segregation and condensation protein A [Leucothrix arctica]